MGTLCRIQGVADRRDQGLMAVEAGFAAIEATEALLSTWRKETPLARLGQAQAGETVTVPSDLARLLARAQAFGEQTAGGFDPAIGALVQAWDLRGEGRVPAAAELASALARSGMGKVAVDLEREIVTLGIEGLSFDAGGFGKGAGLARAGEALTRLGLRDWLIDFGGQILTDPAGPAQEIPIAHPGDRGRPLARLSLRGLSAATSSFGQRPGHILDPRSGQPAADFGSVTVIGADAMQVDALATGLFVLGPREGLARAEALAGIEAIYLLHGDGQVTARATSGCRELLVAPPEAWPGQDGYSWTINPPAVAGGHHPPITPQDEQAGLAQAASRSPAEESSE